MDISLVRASTIANTALRAWWSVGLLVLLFAILLTGCGQGASDKQDVLRVASQKGGTKALMIASGVTEDLPYRIEWSEFNVAGEMIEAVGANAADVGIGGDAPVLFAYQSGSPIRIIQASAFIGRNPATAVIVPAGSKIRDIHGLVGRSVATARGSAGHLLLLRAMERAGIEKDAIQIRYLSPGDAKAAFMTGAIDAWATWNPFVGAAILHDGAKVVVDARNVAWGHGFTIASPKALVGKQALLADFADRYDRAQKWATQHPDVFAGVLAKETGLPIDVARYTADREMKAVPLDAALFSEQQDILDTFSKVGVVRPTRPVEEAFDVNIVP